MPNTLDEVRRKTAAAWERLAKVPSKVESAWQRTKTGGIGGLFGKRSLPTNAVLPSAYAHLVSDHSTIHGRDRQQTPLRRFNDTIKQLDPVKYGLDPDQYKQYRPRRWEGRGKHPLRHHAEPPPLPEQPPPFPLRTYGSGGLFGGVTAAAGSKAPGGVSAPRDIAQKAVQLARKHNEETRKDTEQTRKHTTGKRRENEEEKEGGGKADGIAAAAFALGHILTDKMREEKEGTRAERSAEKFMGVNGPIAVAVAQLRVSQLQASIRLGHVVQDAVTERIEAQREHEERVEPLTQEIERMKQNIGRFTDAVGNIPSELLTGLLHLKPLTEKELAARGFTDAPGKAFLNHLIKRDKLDPARPINHDKFLDPFNTFMQNFPILGPIFWRP